MFQSRFVKYADEGHRYISIHGDDFLSVSRMIRNFKKPFDRDIISANTAKSEGISQEELLKQWDEKRDNASEFGNNVHQAIESYLKVGQVNPEYGSLIKQLAVLIKPYYQVFSEVVLAHLIYEIAGTADLVCVRQKSKNPVVDIYDFKTNLERGIEFDSSRIKDGTLKHYNNFMTLGLSHLEQANYNSYTLQLSAYAYMLQEEFKVRIGRLGILFIDKKLNLIPVPVFYALETVEQMFIYCSGLKPLPGTSKISRKLLDVNNTNTAETIWTE